MTHATSANSSSPFQTAALIGLPGLAVIFIGYKLLVLVEQLRLNESLLKRRMQMQIDLVNKYDRVVNVRLRKVNSESF